MIPGFLITWVTFPGVIVHELAHAIFCRLFGLAIYEVSYFRFSMGFGQPAGYVIHQRAEKPWQDLMVSIGPFFVNTILGAVIAAPAAIPFSLGNPDPLDLLLMWLGVSIAMHSFPSTGDASSALVFRRAEGNTDPNQDHRLPGDRPDLCRRRALNVLARRHLRGLRCRASAEPDRPCTRIGLISHESLRSSKTLMAFDGF